MLGKPLVNTGKLQPDFGTETVHTVLWALYLIVVILLGLCLLLSFSKLHTMLCTNMYYIGNITKKRECLTDVVISERRK